MGLDMYLMKDIYVGAQYKHNNVTGTLDIIADGKPLGINLANVASIREATYSWRKSNHIHDWFVENVQDGQDDCKEYDVSFEKLMELKELCKKALEKKDTELLPRVGGFFFGSYEYDEYYWKDTQETLDMLETLVDGNYVYRASW